MRQAAIAGLAGICLIAGGVIQNTGQPKVGELTVELININAHATSQIAGGIVTGLGLIGLALTLNFLFLASRARRPETAVATKWCALIGGVLAAIGGAASAVVLASKAQDFVANGSQTYLEANHLVRTSSVVVLQYAGLIGSLLLAIGYVLIAMNAMRVGLLTKFLGYLGIAAAAASLFLIGSPIGLLVEVFWLMAVAYLLAGRWPGGDPPSWRTGQAEPWPSSAQMREERQQGSAKRGRAPAKAAARRPEPAKATQPTTRSATPKRKRKRRK
jgi:hypothetical protein